ncbi:unnamed protein product [Rotaria sp. Silwood1]|nr:unnamed protein product [Rotaria sp. Silwood1]CAF0749181.1 unnamed protein product [Rotaria sp. Silwood1]CAF3348528.1 unnamed protein product [Rotaria sp. Silwood1]CAF4542201.1 unnamed protein product [Rotaria sp. Silwood1]
MFSNRRIKKRSNRLCCFIIILFIFFLLILKYVYKLSPFYPSQSKNCSQLCPYSSILSNDTLQFDSTHFIRHFPDFVCPQNFRNLADWVYGWPNQFREHLKQTTNQGIKIAPCLPPGSIIYVRIWVINEFFDQVYPHLQNKFVLVTGEGDLSSPIHMEILESSNSKIIHWFGQNGQYDVSRSKKFTHIPIGINCYEMADAIQNVYSQQQNHTIPSIFNEFDEPSSYIQPQDVSHRALTTKIEKENLVLINFDKGTDKSGLRSRIWKSMCTSKNRANYTFIKCIGKPGGVQIEELPKLYERNRQYPFWLSPRGNGIDCHRTWEALYLDIIPIVWNNSLNVLYENLPVLIINGYEELNEKFLYEKLNEISKKKLSKNNVYQYEKLRNAYWRRLILNKSRHRNKKSLHQRTKRCWSAKSTVNWKQFLSH